MGAHTGYFPAMSRIKQTLLIPLQVAAQSDKVLTIIIDILTEFGDQLKFLQILAILER